MMEETKKMMDKCIRELKEHNPSQEVLKIFEELCVFAAKQEQKKLEFEEMLSLNISDFVDSNKFTLNQ